MTLTACFRYEMTVTFFGVSSGSLESACNAYARAEDPL